MLRHIDTHLPIGELFGMVGVDAWILRMIYFISADRCAIVMFCCDESICRATSSA